MEIAFSIIAATIVSFIYRSSARFCEDENLEKWRWFKGWLWLGVGIPLLIWITLNGGVLFGFPGMLPLSSLIEIGGGSVWRGFSILTAAALVLIVSYWAAVTLGWWLMALFYSLKGESRTRAKNILFVWTMVLFPVFLLLLFREGAFMAGFGMTLWFWPIVYALREEGKKLSITPNYNHALSRMAFGKYEDAEWEVLNQLEQCEDDFDGWMLLADLYANQFHDLTVAHKILIDLSDQPNITPSQMAIAMHKLADWHLKLGSDPGRARWALERISKKFPGSHIAHMAQLRIKNLPVTREELLKPHTIRLPGQKEMAEKTEAAPIVMDREAAARIANQCVEKLQKDPNDVHTREKFAKILAENLNKIDEAMEQVDLLLDMPEQPSAKIAEWLNTMALWHIQFRQDTETARNLLIRIIREFPQTAYGFTAQQRLNLMNAEEKFRKARAAHLSIKISLEPK